jgi:hypothetical protein
MAERHFCAARGTEKIGHEREIAALDSGEEQRRSTGGDDPSMNLRHFEPRIDRRLDDRDVPPFSELGNEGPQVGETHFVHPRNIASPPNLQFQSF